MSKYDVVIQNGTIITASDIYQADIGVRDGKIVEIADVITTEAARVVDAKGKYVIPGGIDAHTHLDMPFGGTFSSDDFQTGTKAAAIGGTTAVIDYSVQPGGGTLADALRIWKEKAEKSCIDYGFHIAITNCDESAMKEIPVMMEEGVTSFKVYMVYDGMRVDDEAFLKILEESAKCGALVGVHCENYYVIKHLTEEFLAAGKVEPIYHAMSRPAQCEGEAANRAIALAEMAKAPLMIVHNTCEESISKIKAARERGLQIMGETCPQYLLLSEDNYEEPNFGGAKYVMSPPLRNKKNWEYIWKQIKDGTILTVATDHCPFFLEQKNLGKDNFAKIPNGAPGIEARLPLMFTYGPKNGLTLQKIVEVTATNPAKIYGMYPQKGTIAIGSDADIVIYDPNKKTTMSKTMMHENVDYTSYEGFELDGYPIMTLSRGEVIAENGQYVGDEKRGKYMKRGVGEIL